MVAPNKPIPLSRTQAQDTFFLKLSDGSIVDRAGNTVTPELVPGPGVAKFNATKWGTTKVTLYANADGDTFEKIEHVPASDYTRGGPQVVHRTPVIIKQPDAGLWLCGSFAVLALILWLFDVPIPAVLIVGAVFGMVIGAGLHAAWGRQ